MKKNLICIAVVFMMQHYGHAQSSFDPTWAGRFQEVLDSVVAVQGIMGASAAVLVPGEGIWSGISGNSMPGVPLSSGMRFGIGSNTKLFIAVLLAKLQEDGVLSLDDSLDKWLPSFPHIDSSITIRQLLNHQSGIYNFTDRSGFWNAVRADSSHFWTPQDIIGYILAPDFEPGTGWRYSNTNYILAGMIIEAATGKSWVQKLHEIIFDPLDMDSTFVGAYEPANGPIAGYQWWGGVGPWLNYPVTSYFSSVGSAGAILSTPNEMVQWYSALFSGQLVSTSSLQQILDFDAASLYGLGILIDADNSLKYSWYLHGGWAFGYCSQIIFDLETRSVFCFIKNKEPDANWGVIINPMMSVLYFQYPRKQNDVGIIQIDSPGEHACTETVIPKVTLKNFGSGQLTSFNIYCKLDTGNPSIFKWSGNLSPGDTTSVSLGSLIPGNGFHSLTCYTSAPNNASDGYPFNDTLSVHFIESLVASSTLPLFEDFENSVFPPEGWLSNPDVFMQWGRTILTSYTGSACAVKCNYADWHIGSRYNLDLPMVNLTGITNPMLYFTYAYTAGPQRFDTLKVQISTDCGSNWQTLFYKGGYDLKTGPWYSMYPFFPESNQWKNEFISLVGFTGDVIIRFQEICENGNNLFLDDVKVEGGVGINEWSSQTTALKIFPNPSSSQIQIEIPGKGHITILNLSGQQLMQQEITEQTTNIDVSTLPNSVYIIRYQNDNMVQIGKLIKI
ncbi:MAG: serine hydrolase [Lentimicrobium sp.]